MKWFVATFVLAAVVFVGLVWMARGEEVMDSFRDGGRGGSGGGGRVGGRGGRAGGGRPAGGRYGGSRPGPHHDGHRRPRHYGGYPRSYIGGSGGSWSDGGWPWWGWGWGWPWYWSYWEMDPELDCTVTGCPEGRSCFYNGFNSYCV